MLFTADDSLGNTAHGQRYGIVRGFNKTYQNYTAIILKDFLAFDVAGSVQLLSYLCRRNNGALLLHAVSSE